MLEWYGMACETSDQFHGLLQRVSFAGKPAQWQDLHTLCSSLNTLLALFMPTFDAALNKTTPLGVRFDAQEEALDVPKTLIYMPNFKFRRTIETAVATWKRVKFFLVGDSGVGKSSLLRFLKDEPFRREHVSTKLADLTTIDVRDWKTLKRESDHLWDMLVDSSRGEFKTTKPSQLPTLPTDVVPTISELALKGQEMPDIKHTEKRWFCPDREAVFTPSRLENVDHAVQRLSASPLSMAFAVWDFAGQEVYYNIHHLLLTSAAVYVLVVNIADPKPDRILFWLQSIRCQTEKAPIVLVLSHTDELRDQAIRDSSDFDDLYHRNLRLVRSCLQTGVRLVFDDPALTNVDLLEKEDALVIDVSCKTGEHREELRNLLTRVAEEEVAQQQRYPVSYMFYFDKLTTDERLPKDAKISPQSHANVLGTLDLDSVIAIGAACGLDRVEATKAINLFHNLGFLFWFSRREELRRLVFMHPQRLVNILQIVVQEPQQLERLMASKADYHRLYRSGLITNISWSKLCQGYNKNVSETLRNLLLEFRLAILSEKGLTLPSLVVDDNVEMKNRLSRLREGLENAHL